PVRQLAVEAVFRTGVRAGVLEQVDVEPAVVIEVEQGRARADDLRHEIAAGRAGVVREVEAAFRRDVPEPDGTSNLFRDRRRDRRAAGERQAAQQQDQAAAQALRARTTDSQAAGTAGPTVHSRSSGEEFGS